MHFLHGGARCRNGLQHERAEEMAETSLFEPLAQGPRIQHPRRGIRQALRVDGLEHQGRGIGGDDAGSWEVASNDESHSTDAGAIF